MNAETRRVYRDSPLADLPPRDQHLAIAGAARGFLTSVGVTGDFRVASAIMSWDPKRKRFYLKFDDVCVDGPALYVAWMTPRGIHMFQHDGEAGLAGGAGVGATRKFVYCAPGGKNGYADPHQAEEYLMKNLAWYELPYTGFMEFCEGDAEKVRAYTTGRVGSNLGA